MENTRTVVFVVPELALRPAMGGGCCAVASAWLIEETLSQIAGVERVHADDDVGEVEVTLISQGAKVQEITAALQSLGFLPVDLRRDQ